jgi:hypothetical protein
MAQRKVEDQPETPVQKGFAGRAGRGNEAEGESRKEVKFRQDVPEPRHFSHSESTGCGLSPSGHNAALT